MLFTKFLHHLRRHWDPQVLEDAPKVAIIVPVFNAPERVEACLKSIQVNTNVPHRLIVIDDGSTDPAVAKLLHLKSWPSHVEIIRHPENRGYTSTINEGISLAGTADVILLNSDTQVPPRWVQNLIAAARSGQKIGTVTALSDNAGAFSAPLADETNVLPADVPFDTTARAISQGSPRLYPRVPTGNGFCLYIKRACLNEVGLFDEQKFPRGYGEENEFCQRALARGWTHIVDDATFVRHARSASFGSDRESLVLRGNNLVHELFPHYKRQIARMRKDSLLAAARNDVRRSIYRATEEPPIRPRILFVISTLVGGTPRTNEDLMRALAKNVESFVLHSDARRITLMHFVEGRYQKVASYRLRRKLVPFPHDSEEYGAVVSKWLTAFSIELVHIRHIAWHGLGLGRVARQLGLPVVMSFHDFYSICPSVRLLDEEGLHRPENLAPADAACRHVLWGKGIKQPLSTTMRSLGDWRLQMSGLLSACSVFITTSNVARDLHKRFLPATREKRFHVIPHGRDFERFERIGRIPELGERMRVLVPGNISASKGAHILAEMGTLAHDGRFEFHVLGKSDKALRDMSNIVLHGDYDREDFVEKVRAIAPHMGMILSIWPETYCHTLTEMWACGLPVAAIDIGALRERLRAFGGGWLISEMKADVAIQTLDSIRADSANFVGRLSDVARWQAGEGTRNSCATMALAYMEIYEDLISADRIQVTEHSSSQMQ